MSVEMTTELASFHEFVAEQLKAGGAAMSPEEALLLWRDRTETLAALHEGLNAVEAGATKPVERFVNEFCARHGLANGHYG